MNKLLSICTGAAFFMLASCSEGPTKEMPYNKGINVIPTPVSLNQNEGSFKVSKNMAFCATTPEAQTVAKYFASKMNTATGYNIIVGDKPVSKGITFALDQTLQINDEGYNLEVTSDGINISAKTPQGLFYGMQTFMQLLPAEIESPAPVTGIAWVAPAVSVKDEPRFAYRGIMMDPCRHFMTVDKVKQQLDVLALFKINRMHWHLTDDQGWRIEIKKYPKLTEIGSKRIEGEGYEYGGFYTQDEIKDVVKYAAERFITIVPEIEMPGHELAAIAAYPELSCKSEPITPRIIWGVEDIVMCPGKEQSFEFLQDVIDEVAPLFPGEYIHIGGDECPKISWKNCPLCQQLIKKEGLQSDKTHSSEEKLQSYVIQRMEKYIAEKHGKKIIGWDEILEGGLAPSATVMSWRGEEGGIAAATQDHDVIMTPGSCGLYLDQFEGDSKIEPVSIGGFSTIEKVYSYNPVPDTLEQLGKGSYVKGVQGNVWAEYLYTDSIREYRTYPRIIALSEIAWSPLNRKDYKDFERRLENALVRLDEHGINYYIPQPEQPNGSCNFVAFTDSAVLTFTTNRPMKIVYTIDGSEPTPTSSVYTEPIIFTNTGVLKIRSVLSSGKMSPTRIINVEKQALAPAAVVDKVAPGLKMEVTDGMYLKTSDIPTDAQWRTSAIKDLKEIREVVKTDESMRNVKQYAAIASGYVDIPEDGVYYISSDNEEVWIDGKMIISNSGEVKRFSRHDTSLALAKGLHPIKVVFLGHIIGGWPSNWNDGSVKIRKSDETSFRKITPDMLKK